MDYFLAILPIWDAYFEGKISMVKREALLRPYREELRAEMREKERASRT